MAGCIPVKSIFLGWPDAKDLTRSNYHEINSGGDCFEFHRPPDGQEEITLKVNDWATDIPFFITVEELVKAHKVRSLVIIKNDTILNEFYGQNTTKDDFHPSYSVAKSVMSTLIGIAIDEGKIKSEKELVINYIPELKSKPMAETLTIEHLLNHTSGIKYTFSADATVYYGNDQSKAIDRMKFEVPPGTKQHYLNINILMLGMVLQKATGVKPSEYLQEKLWKPLGMCNSAIWLADKKEVERTYCCIGATALDYAKFGRLYLNKGVWDGKRIISQEWYDKSIRRDTAEGSSFNYNYCWHIGLKEYDDYMAIGMYKQHIYINHKKNLLIVLLKDKEDLLVAERLNWWNLFRQIADQL